MVEVTVSRATPSDIDELVPLVEAYREFYGQAPDDKTVQYVTDRLAKEEAVVFIARRDARAVGFTLIYPTFSTVALAQIWLLNDLFVAESFRGSGIASRLMEAAEQAAREAGAARIWLRTAEDNMAAQALYDGRGWAEDLDFRRYDLTF